MISPGLVAIWPLTIISQIMSISAGQHLPQSEQASRDYVIPSLTATEQISLSIVIPTYNESRNIGNLVAILSNLLDETIPQNYELIVVDDDSPDHTWEIAQSLIRGYPQLRVIRRQQEKGLSSAVIQGWQRSKGEILGVIDGDLQHPPETLLQLIAAMQNGADLAVASRHVDGGGVSDWSIIRRLLSRGAQTLGLIILPEVIGRVSDPMSGYFLVNRRAIAQHYFHPLGYKILIEVLARGQIDRIVEVGYLFQERQAGESKVSKKHYFDYLYHLIHLRFSLGKIGQLRSKFSFPLKRFISFGLVGLSGVFVDMSLLYLLHDSTSLGLGLTRSKIIAAEVAILNNFIWNDAWTFGDMSRQQRGLRPRLLRLLKFNLVCLLGLTLNVLLLNLLFNVFKINYLLANLIAIAAVTFWNFWINLKLNWRVTDMEH